MPGPQLEGLRPEQQERLTGNGPADDADRSITLGHPGASITKPKRKASTLRLSRRRKAKCSDRGYGTSHAEPLLWPTDHIQQNSRGPDEASAGYAVPILQAQTPLAIWGA